MHRALGSSQPSDASRERHLGRMVLNARRCLFPPGSQGAPKGPPQHYPHRAVHTRPVARVTTGHESQWFSLYK